MQTSIVKNRFVILLLLISLLYFTHDSAAQQTSVQKNRVVTFEEVSAKASGITWVHNNAHSPERYLPETVGAGCAFLHYDNDGWLDIYLVNSGPSDFFTPKSPSRTPSTTTTTTARLRT